jgi:hypothetical protein
MFRRNQVWFVEKDRLAATTLYSLAEYRAGEGRVRNDASFEKDYIAGRYGAIPFIGGIEQILRDPPREQANSAQENHAGVQ